MRFTTFNAFKYRDYRFLWVSTACSNSGRWSFTMGVGWLVYSLSHKTGLVGLSMFLSMVPAVLFNPFVGVLADRYDRRRLFSIALLSCAAATGCLAVLLALHVATTWMVLVCSFVVGTAFSVQMTASNAMMPNLVPKKTLFNAASLMGTVNQGSEFMGSALAMPVLMLIGPWAVFALCFVLYTCAGFLSMLIHSPVVSVVEHSKFRIRHLFRPMLEGISYIRSTKPLGTLVILVAFHCSLTMAYTVLLPEFAKTVLQGGSGTYGTLMTIVGLGAIAGTVGTASISGRRSLGNLYLVTALLSGLSLFGLGNVHFSGLAYASGFFIGSSQAVFMAVSLAFMMQPTHDQYRGRVSSVYSLMAAGFMALATYGYGLLGNVVAPKVIMITTGGLFTLLFALGLLFSPAIRFVCRGTIGGDVPAAPLVDVSQ